MSVENEPRVDRKTIQIAAVVIAVVILIGIGVYVYNKEKIGKSSDPAAQQAALTLLDSIPVHWPAAKSWLFSRTIR
jgi:hypothetical protein